MKRKLGLLALLALLLSTHIGQVEAQKLRRANRPLLRAPKGYARGYAPYIKWRVTLGLGDDTTPAIADLDLDGTMDIVLPSVDGPALYRLSQNGEVIWRVALSSEPTAGVALGDVDRDGTLDIVVACENSLLCFDANGKEKWKRTFTEEIHSMPVIADLEGDGRSEVIIGANDNRVHALDFRGRDKWSFITKSWITGGVAVADLDNDGKLEVGFGSLDFKLYCLNSDGKLRFEYSTGDWMQGSVVFADVDRDGGTDMVAASDDGHIYCLSRRGTLKWKTRFSEPKRQKPYLAVGDLDNDGTLETLMTSSHGYLRCFTAWGDEVWQVGDGNSGESTDEEVAVTGSPLIADLNGDGWPEVSVAARDGHLRAYSGWGNLVFEHNVGGIISSSPLLFDADNDKQWEFYIGNTASAERDSGFFSQYELSRVGGQAGWTTVGGDPYRTNATRNARDYSRNVVRGGDYASSWEPFGIGYRPRTGVQPPRRLRVTALPIQDVNGNRDGVLDPGETALWRVQIENLGKGPSYDNLLAVNLGKTFLRIDRTRSYLGWIAPGAKKIATFRLSAPPIAEMWEWIDMQEGRAATPFREIAPEDVVAPAAIGKNSKLSTRIPPRAELASPVTARVRRRQPATAVIAKLQVLESGVQAAASQAKLFNMPPLPPTLRIARRQIIDSQTKLTSGNGNGRLEAGETAILRLWLRNENLTTAQTATATLRSSSPNILVATPTALLKNVVPYGSRQVDFSLRIGKQIKSGNAVLRLEIQPVVERGAPVPANVQLVILPLRAVGSDTTPPQIVFNSPRTRIASTTKAQIVISGVVSDASGIAAFRFEGQSIVPTKLPSFGKGKRRFVFRRALIVGENVFTIDATDTRGNSTSQWVRVIRKPISARPTVAVKKPRSRG